MHPFKIMKKIEEIYCYALALIILLPSFIISQFDFMLSQRYPTKIKYFLQDNLLKINRKYDRMDDFPRLFFVVAILMLLINFTPLYLVNIVCIIFFVIRTLYFNHFFGY